MAAKAKSEKEEEKDDRVATANLLVGHITTSPADRFEGADGDALLERKRAEEKE